MLITRLLAASMLLSCVTAAGAAYAQTSGSYYWNDNGTQSCTYQGGPKSELWSCR